MKNRHFAFMYIIQNMNGGYHDDPGYFYDSQRMDLRTDRLRQEIGYSGEGKGGMIRLATYLFDPAGYEKRLGEPFDLDRVLRCADSHNVVLAAEAIRICYEEPL